MYTVCPTFTIWKASPPSDIWPRPPLPETRVRSRLSGTPALTIGPATCTELAWVIALLPALTIWAGGFEAMPLLEFELELPPHPARAPAPKAAQIARVLRRVLM